MSLANKNCVTTCSRNLAKEKQTCAIEPMMVRRVRGHINRVGACSDVLALAEGRRERADHLALDALIAHGLFEDGIKVVGQIWVRMCLGPSLGVGPDVNWDSRTTRCGGIGLAGLAVGVCCHSKFFFFVEQMKRK